MMRSPTVVKGWQQSIPFVALLLAGCAPVGIAEDWREGFVKVYNRTLAVINFEHGWVPICSDGFWRLPDWEPSPTVTAPPGAVPVTVDLDVPPDFRGVVSVIVSETGVEVIHGDPGEMPDCAGLPPA